MTTTGRGCRRWSSRPWDVGAFAGDEPELAAVEVAALAGRRSGGANELDPVFGEETRPVSDARGERPVPLVPPSRVRWHTAGRRSRCPAGGVTTQDHGLLGGLF